MVAGHRNLALIAGSVLGLSSLLRESGPVIVISRDDDDRVDRIPLDLPFIDEDPRLMPRREPAEPKPRLPRIDSAVSRERQMSAAEAKRARKNARRLSLSRRTSDGNPSGGDRRAPGEA